VSQAGFGAIPVGPGLGFALLLIALVALAYEIGRRRSASSSTARRRD
jgi:hypothetical protein